MISLTSPTVFTSAELPQKSVDAVEQTARVVRFDRKIAVRAVFQGIAALFRVAIPQGQHDERAVIAVGIVLGQETAGVGFKDLRLGARALLHILRQQLRRRSLAFGCPIRDENAQRIGTSGGPQHRFSGGVHERFGWRRFLQHFAHDLLRGRRCGRRFRFSRESVTDEEE